jgi:hypothetical protein
MKRTPALAICWFALALLGSACEKSQASSELVRLFGESFAGIEIGKTTMAEFQKKLGSPQGGWYQNLDRFEALAIHYDSALVIRMVIAWPQQEYGQKLRLLLRSEPSVLVGVTVDGQAIYSYFDDRVRILVSRDGERVLAIAVRGGR